MEQDEIYYSGKTFFYSLIFFLIFIIGPIIYWIDPDFRMWIDLQWVIIRGDWQLTFVFILLIGITIGHLLLEGVALALIGALMKINWALEHRLVKVIRFWLSAFLIIVILLSLLFDLESEIILVIALSGILASVLLAFEWKAQIFTKVREISQGSFEIDEYIEFDGKTWLKSFIYLGAIIILILMYWRNLLGFRDWVDLVLSVFESNSFLFGCLILFLIFTIFWKLLEFILLLGPLFCAWILRDVVAQKIYRTKIFALILITSILIFKNLPFLAVREDIRFTISVVVVVVIELLRWRLRIPRV